MSFLKKMLKDAVSEGINKGIKEAVSAAAEKIVAPKAEEYANKMASTLDEATKTLDKQTEEETVTEKTTNLSSLENALNKMAAAAEKYAETLEGAAQNQEDVIKLFNEKLPGMPAWCFGGKNFEFVEVGQDINGWPYYSFQAEGCTQEGLDMYCELLKQNGFVRKYPSSDEVLYKDLGGEYLVMGKTTAFESDPVMTLDMCRTKDKSEIQI